MVNYRRLNKKELIMDTSRSESFIELEMKLEEASIQGYKLIALTGVSNVFAGSSQSRTLIAIMGKETAQQLER